LTSIISGTVIFLTLRPFSSEGSSCGPASEPLHLDSLFLFLLVFSLLRSRSFVLSITSPTPPRLLFLWADFCTASAFPSALLFFFPVTLDRSYLMVSCSSSSPKTVLSMTSCSTIVLLPSSRPIVMTANDVNSLAPPRHRGTFYPLSSSLFFTWPSLAFSLLWQAFANCRLSSSRAKGPGLESFSRPLGKPSQLCTQYFRFSAMAPSAVMPKRCFWPSLPTSHRSIVSSVFFSEISLFSLSFWNMKTCSLRYFEPYAHARHPGDYLPFL